VEQERSGGSGGGRKRGPRRHEVEDGGELQEDASAYPVPAASMGVVEDGGELQPEAASVEIHRDRVHIKLTGPPYLLMFAVGALGEVAGGILAFRDLLVGLVTIAAVSFTTLVSVWLHSRRR